MTKSQEYFRLRGQWKETGDPALLKESSALIASLTEDEKPAFFEAINADFSRIKDDISDIRRTGRIRDALAPVLPSISVANIAKESYGRSAQWFYQRMNGNIVNGRPARFSDTEIETLRAALLDLADRIRCAAESL